MFHWFDVVQNTRGDALGGWQVGLVEVDTQNVVSIFSDENSTPIASVSGVTNRAVADENGNYDFFVPSGTYTLQFYNPAGVFQRAQRFVAMFGADAANTANLASNDVGKGASLVATEGSGTVQDGLDNRPSFVSAAAAVAAIADGAFASYLDAEGLPVYGQRVGSAMVAIDGAWFAEYRVDIPEVADLIAGTTTARGAGAIWRAGVYRYEEAASVATDHDEITAGGVKLYALPDNGVFNTDQFTGGIGERLNKAFAAIKRNRTLTGGWLFDHADIKVPYGNYAFDETIELTSMPYVRIDAYGAVITSTSSADSIIKLVASDRVIINGLGIDLRNNNNCVQAVHIAGQSSSSQFNDIRIQVNSTNTDYASFRMQQGDTSGLDASDRNKGNYWVRFNQCWVRKLQGADAGSTQTCFDLQGAQNALYITDCELNNFVTGIKVRNQASGTASGLTNALNVFNTAFESGVSGGSAVLYTQDGGNTLQVAGGAFVGCRFEALPLAFKSDLTTLPIAPIQIMGSTVISSVTTFIDDANAQEAAFAVHDASITPANVVHRHVSSAGAFFGSIDTVNPSLSASSKVAANGSSIAMRRLDGTIDGRLSQRIGGGMEIDGGTPQRLVLKNVLGLSGGNTHAANFRGTATIADAGTSVAVTLPTAESDASYGIALDVPYDTTAWVSSKTTTGFTINVGTAASGAQTARWLLWR